MGRGVPAQIIEKWMLDRLGGRAPFFLICKARRKKVSCDFASVLTYRSRSQLYKSEFQKLLIGRLSSSLPFSIFRIRMV